MTEREYDTIIAALRYWQGYFIAAEEIDRPSQRFNDCIPIAEDSGEPLSVDEIDALIDKLDRKFQAGDLA